MKKPNFEIPTSSTKITFQDDDSSSSSDDEAEKEIARELADVTFEELLKARSDGSHTVYQKPKLEKKGGRENKNRPMEISSKKPVGRFKEVIQVPKRVVRDPRFESLCGNLDVEGFQKRYNFLYESELPAEKEDVKKMMKKSSDPQVIAGLKDRLAWIDKQLKSVSTNKHTEKAILTEHKKKEREAAKHGKQPYYLKPSDVKKQKLIEKYNELKASGKLDSFIEKRRKKNAAKDHRFMPYRRSNDKEQ